MWESNKGCSQLTKHFQTFFFQPSAFLVCFIPNLTSEELAQIVSAWLLSLGPACPPPDGVCAQVDSNCSQDCKPSTIC